MESESIANCFVVKVCLVGDSCVGKSSLSIRFTRDVFYDNMLPTLGAGFLSKTITNDNGGDRYKFQIWDTAGQERYKSLVPLYYHGAAVVLVVYDVTNRDSLFSGALQWLRELRQTGPPDALYVLVGNKADLIESLREVSPEEGKIYAEKMDAFYCETSAKSGLHVSELFSKICKWLIKSSKVLPCVPYRPDSCSSTADSEKSSKSWMKDFGEKLSFRKDALRSKSLKFRLVGDDFHSNSSCCYF